MKSKLLGVAAALALTTCAVLATSGSASAHWYDSSDGTRSSLAAQVIVEWVAAAASPPSWRLTLLDWCMTHWGSRPRRDTSPAVAAGDGNVAYCEAHSWSYSQPDLRYGVCALLRIV